MDRYLIDTHVLLWWLQGSKRLKPEAREILADGSNVIYLSSGAIWEMSIKRSLGRLDMPDDLEDVLEQEHIDVLPIEARHALAVTDLPPHHRDPFDRIQIAQAQLERLTIVSRDDAFASDDVGLVLA